MKSKLKSHIVGTLLADVVFDVHLVLVAFLYFPFRSLQRFGNLFIRQRDSLR